MIRPEDESKINEMTIALRLSKESACILLVSFNDELLRRDVEGELKRRLESEGFNFREYRVTEDAYRNLPIMLVDMKPQPEDIFLIYDLKNALPEVLEYLNYRREDFVEHNISAIFWLDEPTLTLIARKALDFWAFRSLPVFEFNVDRLQDLVMPDRTTLDDIFVYNSLEELEDKIALREELLKDYLEKRPRDRSTIANLHDDLGILYHSKSQFDKAIAHCQKALCLCREINDKGIEARALSNMGSAYRAKGELDKALEYISQALDVYRGTGNVGGEANALGKIGLVHRDKGKLDKALKYMLQALDLYRRIESTRGEANILDNMGSVYLAKGELDKAMESSLQALNVYREAGYDRWVAYTLDYIGLVYQAKGDLDEAMEYHSQALRIFRRIGDMRGEAWALDNTGIAYKAKGDLRAALEYTKKALRISIPIGAALLADRSYRNLQEIIEQMEATGMELSDEDRREITELTEEYEKLKGEAAGVTSG